MAFSFRQIQYFVAVAEHGAVSRAAHGLSISQSTVTEAIQELEGDLGFALFERRASGVELTLKGHQFLRHARKILSDIADARRALKDEAAPVDGRLALGVTPLVASYVLSDLLARFRRAFPGVTVEIVEDGREYLEHLLVGGELDVAVVVAGVEKNGPAFHAETVDASRYRLWLPIGHPLAERPSIAVAELAREPFVLLALDEIAEAAEEAWRRARVRPPVAIRTRSVEAARSLVATGAGVAILPDLAYRPWSLEGDKIEARDLAEDLPPVEVAIVWRRGSPLSRVAGQFVAVAQTWRGGRGR
ncbi:LysR family transcriptional regulator [Labrys wisconsinensis]|uniref:DNA-binding transcriptional LysR family regulator n=1 Tax=Labrys wisconsinensis TaxID=425677 RepID=A0ABU0JAI2_9HYPH|nr:LysR family transcriptional regulator [Labrys wisconsinensis]MDQ0471279.1 DNA-binding transcriptional LysR family regulator [Labrys wisconsinensis]